MTHFILRWDKSLFFSYSFSLKFVSFCLNSKRKNEAILKKTLEIREFGAKKSSNENTKIYTPRAISVPRKSQCGSNEPLFAEIGHVRAE